MSPGPPAVLDGRVWHERRATARHRFDVPVSYVWIDPDRPDDLTRHHPWWSVQRIAPVRFRRRDYGDSARPHVALAEQARADLAPVLDRPHGELGSVRMLTQLRRWGWLFNPITVYLVWPDGGDGHAGDVHGGRADPVGAVLEVTNTPWHERHRYAVPLTHASNWLVTSFPKQLHVSPFLGVEYRYDLRLRWVLGRLDVRIDVVSPDGDIVLRTGVAGAMRRADRRVLADTLRRVPLSTIRVSLGIHWQALRLWLKRVPVVAHPGS